MKQFKLSLFLFVHFAFANAQSADITQGCLPLTVKFEAPTNPSGYFWSFGDGNSSELQFPEHIYINAGDYLVELFEVEGGFKIGEINIEVYQKPIISFNASTLVGCTPLTVNFTSSVSTDPRLGNQSYLWSFGDGAKSNDKNPSYTYTNPGLMSVSLEVTTEIEGCETTELKTEYILVEGPIAAFEIDKIYSCTFPVEININTAGTFSSENVYLWDFGDGQSSSEFAPQSITYESEGLFIISQTVTSPEGCSSTFKDTVLVGSPPLELDVPSIACQKDSIVLAHNIFAEFLDWDLPKGVALQDKESITDEPLIRIDEGGVYTFNLTAYFDENCASDTSFQITIEEPYAGFTIDPEISCADPITVSLDAINDDYKTYTWNGVEDGSQSTFTYDDPPRDSFYLHFENLISVELIVETENGCTDTIVNRFIQRIPDAIFLPDVIVGCAPLEVKFEDLSESYETIINWHYTFGNGDEASYSNSLQHEYTFTEPGTYCVKLDIENSAGCRDTSVCTWIRVLPNLGIELGGPERGFCIGDEFKIEMPIGTEIPIDGWQVEIKDLSFSHCWLDDSAIFTINAEPGVYELNYVIPTGPCQGLVGPLDLLVVNGANSLIGYEFDCSDPTLVHFRNKGQGATRVLWNFDGLGMSTDSITSFRFPASGDYLITLEVENEPSMCDPHFSQKLIKIRDVKAEFTVPDVLCDKSPILFDASTSENVDGNCQNAYTWLFPETRPRTIGSPFIRQLLPAGESEVTLIARDVNGCRDTITKTVSSYGITANFDQSVDFFCEGGEIQFMDLSFSDTSIVSWNWDFGIDDPNATANVQNPTFTYDMIDTSFYTIVLEIENAVGCKAQAVKIIRTYEIDSEIIDPLDGICTGTPFELLATDFKEQGSYLDFSWDMGNGETIEGINPMYTYNEAGNFQIILTYTEAQSGCIGMDTIDFLVADLSQANFTTNVDGISPLCHPQIIEFTNGTDSTAATNFLWSFGEGSQSFLHNPVFSYGRGTYEVTLTNNVLGCESATTQSFTLVGPEGFIEADKTEICVGEEVTFTLSDTIDVSSWVWDFGDGNTLSGNENPVSHVFDQFPEDGEFEACVVLSSEDTGCEFFNCIPINIGDVKADFEGVALGYCEGLASFENNSEGAASYVWQFGDGNTSNEENPNHNYGNTGNYTVTLIATDAEQFCTDEFSQEITLAALAEFGLFPNVFSPNNDGRNDFFNIVVEEEFQEFMEVVTFKIFNRWGELIYNNETPSQGWDGRKENIPSPAEVYAYFIEVNIQNCNTIQMKGNVTLIR